MASLAVTYDFVEDTSIDPDQMNQNFTDVIDFVNTSVVHADGSIAFTGIPSLPASDPTTANQASRKSYVDSAIAAAVAAASVVPVGALFAWSTATAPTGYLLCYGQAVSRSTYSGLFAVVSTLYGVGDGATTFNLPDLRGRVVAALDNMGGSDAGRLSLANTIGTAGGEQLHTMTEAELYAHTHSVTAVQSGATNAQPYDGFSPGPIGLDSASIVSTSKGSTTPFNVMQPTLLMTYIIKT